MIVTDSSEVWIEPNKRNQRIFEDKKKDVGLFDVKIDVLFLKERGNEILAELIGFYGRVWNNPDGSYTVRINESMIRKHGRTIRSSIRHELAHIKYGDCESGDNLPTYLRHIFRDFVHEPQAEAYARREFVEPYSHDCVSTIKGQIALFSKRG